MLPIAGIEPGASNLYSEYYTLAFPQTPKGRPMRVRILGHSDMHPLPQGQSHGADGKAESCSFTAVLTPSFPHYFVNPNQNAKGR